MGEILVPKMQTSGAETTPWTKRRAAIAMRIELTALRLCVERAIEDVTVDELAAAVGISRRTFYHYFESIEDVFSEMPRRSMEQLCRDFSARPAGEPVVQAYLCAIRNRRPSEEEREIRRLAIKVAQRSPETYWRSVTRTCDGGTGEFQRVVANRLRATGQDPDAAQLITTILLSVTGQVSRQSGVEGEFQADPDRLEAELRTVAKVMDGMDEADGRTAELRTRVSG